MKLALLALVAFLAALVLIATAPQWALASSSGTLLSPQGVQHTPRRPLSPLGVGVALLSEVGR